MGSYLQNFESREDIEKAYDCKIPADAEILLAWYGYGDYCGDSLVLYRLDGKLYEVNGGHCSCNGLEGQWEPEETSYKALKMRNISGECEGSSEAQEQLDIILIGLRVDEEGA